MRRVALLLVLIFTAIAFVDPLYCSDGCTRADIAATGQCAPHGGDCPICQPGSVAAMPTSPIAGLVPTAATVSFEQSPLESIPRSIEHPPRT
jgi:hypothetical protein